MWTSSVAYAPMTRNLDSLAQQCVVLCTPLERVPFQPRGPLCWKPFECGRVLTLLSPCFRAYCLIMAVNCRPVADAVWHVAVQEFYKIALVRLLQWLNTVLLIYRFMMTLGRARVLVGARPASMPRCVCHCRLASSVHGCAIDLALPYFAYLYSAEIDVSSEGAFTCWFPPSFADGRVFALLEDVLLSQKRDASVALGEDTVSPSRDIVWSAASADLCIMDDAVSHLHPSQHTDR